LSGLTLPQISPDGKWPTLPLRGAGVPRFKRLERRPSWSEVERLFGRPEKGMWKRYVAAKVKTRKGKRLRQRDIPMTVAGSSYAQAFLEEHQDRDLYFTPALFKHTKDGRRTATQAAWTSWIWLDIDGVPGARTGGEAWAVLANTLDDLRVPQPNLVFCTSEQPNDPHYLPRLQCYWRIVPLYVGKLEARRLWRRVAGGLADALAAAGFRVDRGASTNLVGLMRLPGSVHPKTGTRVYAVGPQHDGLYTLSKLGEALEVASRSQRRKRGGARPVTVTAGPRGRGGRGRIRELPHMRLLAGGVPEGLRNTALYALAKALWADGVPLEEAVAWRPSPASPRSRIRAYAHGSPIGRSGGSCGDKSSSGIGGEGG